jgi:hypothetical protein
METINVLYSPYAIIFKLVSHICCQSPVEKSQKLQRFRSPNTQLLSDSDKEGLTVETEIFSGSVRPVYVRLHLLIKISELLIASKISFVILTLIL